MRARLGDVKDRACFAEMPVAFKLMIYAEILLSREVPMTEFNPLDETDILLACDRYCEAVNNLPDDDAWLDIVVKGTRWYSVLKRNMGRVDLAKFAADLNGIKVIELGGRMMPDRRPGFAEAYIHLNLGEMLWSAVEREDFDTYSSSMVGVFVGNTILGLVLPQCTGKVSWRRVFGKKGFTLAGRKPLKDRGVNGFFSSNGELMGLPYPLDTTVEGSDICRVVETNTPARTEPLGLLMTVCPFSGVAARTVASAQGSTTNGEVLVPLSKITPAEQLVAMTRNTKDANLKISGLDEIFKGDTREEANTKKTLRLAAKRKISSFHFRQ